MEVRLYQDSDFDTVAEWGLKWGSTYTKGQLPPTGVIVPGVAVQFMYLTDSTVAFLENLVSNKDEQTETVRQACTLILAKLLEMAKEKGCTVAYACTNNPHVVTRAVLAGAKAEPNYVLLTKSI